MTLADRVRQLGVVAGIGVIVVGLLLISSPSTADAVPVSIIVADVAALGAVGLGGWAARKRYRTKIDRAAVPDVEFPLTMPTPGDQIDDLIYRLSELREGTLEYRERIYERVRDVTIAVLMEQQQCSREHAVSQIESGNWTDDADAITFFQSGGKGTQSATLSQTLRRRVGDTTSQYERQLESTVAAIEEIAGIAPDSKSQDSRSRSQKHSRREVDTTDDEGTQVTETVRYYRTVQTHHWSGLIAFGLLALSVGILASQPAVVLCSGVGIAVSAYARLHPAPRLADLTVSREVSDDAPEPGEEVEITTTVENTGDSFLPDLRLIERVPPTMRVSDGSARTGTALRPGETVTLNYSVVVERGTFSWPLQVVGRDLTGAIERDARIQTDATIECVPRLDSVVEMPVRLQTSMYGGEVSTKDGGEGLEFFSLRDYKPGDPKSRIDWKTYARTGEFSTVDFREEHAAKVVLLFDGRQSSYVASGPGEKHALDHSVEAASDIFAALHDQGHLIGIAGFNGIPCWLAPGTGALHLEKVQNLFIDHPTLSPLPPEFEEVEEGRYIDPMTHVRRQLPTETQLVLFSPLTDRYAYEVARRLDGAGHLVTIISPDPTAGRTVGQRIGRLERAIWLKRARDAGLRVIDWDTEQELPLAVEHARRKWDQ